MSCTNHLPGSDLWAPHTQCQQSIMQTDGGRPSAQEQPGAQLLQHKRFSLTVFPSTLNGSKLPESAKFRCQGAQPSPSTILPWA